MGCMPDQPALRLITLMNHGLQSHWINEADRAGALQCFLDAALITEEDLDEAVAQVHEIVVVTEAKRLCVEAANPPT